MKFERIILIYFVFYLFLSTTVFAQTYDISDFAGLQTALNDAKSQPDVSHTMNINDSIQFNASISNSLSYELNGTNLRTLTNFDLNSFTLEFLGTDKTTKISNLNIIVTDKNSGIISRNNFLSIENSILTGHSSYGKELVKNTNGSLSVTNSKFLNNSADKGSGINFSGTTLNVISSNFTNNKSNQGGAIYISSGDLTLLNSNFSQNTSSKGGAIYLDKGTSTITNSTFDQNDSSSGAGALFINTNTTLTLDNVTFNKNSVTTGSTGGAIINQGDLTIRNGSKFTNNQVALGSGGAITNSGTLNIDSTIFENNFSKNDGGAITDTGHTTITNSSFINNKSTAYYGGAIVSTNDLKIDTCNFEKNSASTYGGALAIMQGTATITNSTFIENTAQSSLGGGAIINYLSTINLKGSNLFQDNTSNTNGGAITSTRKSTINIPSGTQFVGNKADGLGGGIFSQGTINITADNPDKSIIFSGNQDSTGTNAIHLDISQNFPDDISSLNINLLNGSSVIFEDNISGIEKTVVNINGTSSLNDRVYLGSANENLKSQVNAKNVSLEFYNGASGMQNAIITAENTHFNFMNGVISQNKLNLNLIGNDNSLSIDVDPANSTCDYFDLSNTRSAMSNLVIRNINVLSEPKQSKTVFDIFDHNQYGTNLSLSSQLKNKVVYGAVKKYRWTLTPKLTLIELSGFNPNIQRYQTATASAFMNQMLSYDYSLNRTDEIYSNLREMNLAHQKLNSYAYSGQGGTYVEQYYEDNSALWVRPYVNLESFHLSGAISSVGNQSYGTMVGFDFPMVKTKYDWKLFSTLYGAYIGSTQQYKESNMYQNGGYIGYLLSAYKNNFYAGWTINGGGLGVESDYAGGKDDYGIVTAGTALKLVYNQKFRRLIFQPNIVTAYTFLNPTNLVNFQNVDLNQSQVSGLTIMPAMRIVYRNENGFEPYIFAGCVIPIIRDIKAKADSTHLETLKLNSWAQFGTGVRKRVGERVTCFAETIIRTGGRVGWGFMFNIQIAL